jgi:hypothetical protein
VRNRQRTSDVPREPAGPAEHRTRADVGGVGRIEIDAAESGRIYLKSGTTLC